MKKAEFYQQLRPAGKVKKVFDSSLEFFRRNIQISDQRDQMFRQDPKIWLPGYFSKPKICFFETFRSYLVYRELNETFFGNYEK